MRRQVDLTAIAVALMIVAAGPSLAQSIDLSPVQTLLQGIVDAIIGPLGIVIGTLALIGVFLSWLFGILDFRGRSGSSWRSLGSPLHRPSSPQFGPPETEPWRSSRASSSAS